VYQSRDRAFARLIAVLKKTTGAPADLQTALLSLDTSTWGLQALGYEHAGFNGTESDGWFLPAPHDSYATLNIYKPGRTYTGQITIVVDDDVSDPDSWVNVTTGETTRNQRDAVGRWLINYMRGNNFGSPVDIGAITSTHVPGLSVWTASFSTKHQFIARLREAHAMMHDVDNLMTQAALLGFRPYEDML
jgi:hypothetical protein